MFSDFKLIKASVVHARRGRACAAVLVLGGWIALYVLFEELSAYLRMLKHLQVHVYTLCLHVGPSLGRLYSGCSRTRLFPTAPARLPRSTARTNHSDSLRFGCSDSLDPCTHSAVRAQTLSDVGSKRELSGLTG